MTLLQVPVCYNFGFYRREILRSRMRANINSSILILTWETCCKDFWLSIHRKNSFHVLESRRVFTLLCFLCVQVKTFIFRSENKMLSDIALLKWQASSWWFLMLLPECYWSKNHSLSQTTWSFLSISSRLQIAWSVLNTEIDLY